MSLITVAYASSAVTPFTDDQLSGLLQAAVRNNQREGVTGMLVYHDGNFMQVLEGEADSVERIRGAIVQDPRHRGIITLLQQPITERGFTEWAMGFRNADHLTDEERKHFSDFLSRPLTAEEYTAQPSKAMRLLQSFKRSLR